MDRVENKKAVILLLSVPIIVAVVSVYVSAASGPFFQSWRLDPAYAYLFNSLNVYELKQVGHSDHPGSTVQLFGGLIFQAYDVFNLGGRDLAEEFFQDPEYFARLLQISLSILFACSLFLSSILLLPDRKLAILFQLSSVGIFSIWPHLANVSAEPMLASIGMPIAAILLRTIRKKNGVLTPASSCAIGVLSGLGMATKLTFLPIAVLPLFFLRRIWTLELYSLSSGAIFLLFAANPLMNFKEMLGFWTGSIVARKGYNHPPDPEGSIFEHSLSGLSSISGYFANGQLAIFGTVVFVLVLFWIASVYRLRRSIKEELVGGNKRLDTTDQSRVRPLVALTGILVVIAAQTAIVSVSPGAAIHYLLPSLLLSPLCMGIIFEQTRKKKAWSFPVLASAMLVCSIIWGVVHFVFLLDEEKKFDQYLIANANVGSDVAVAGYYRSSSEPYACMFGKNFADRGPDASLSSRFENYFDWNIWSKSWMNFDNKPVELEEILEKYPEGIRMSGRRPFPAGVPGCNRDFYVSIDQPESEISQTTGIECELEFQNENYLSVIIKSRGAE